MTVPEKPVANPVVVLREEFDDWAILYDPDTGIALGTNPVGVAVWKLLDGKTTLEEILREIDARFSQVPASAAAEIAAFLQELTARGFVGHIEALAP